MPYRLPFILLIVAVTLFITAFILDLTSFSQDWNIVWEDIEISIVILASTITIAIGVFLGLFLFRDRPYKQRISLTIPISFILFSIAIILKATVSHYGLDEEYNYFTAKRDIENGKIQILETGLTLPDLKSDWIKQQNVEKIVTNHFGYNYVNLGCFLNNGTTFYNGAMEDYLDKTNGEGWRVKEKQMFDSLMNYKVIK